jgi:hypothetical protein
MNSLILLARIMALGGLLGIVIIMSIQGSFWNLKLRRILYALLGIFIISSCFLVIQFFSK